MQALVTADIEGYVDNARMRQITNVHSSDLTKMLQKLVSLEALIQDGQGRWTQYYLSKTSNSVHMEDNSVRKIEIMAEQSMLLTKIAESARLNKRLSPQKMDSIILELCADTWLSRRYLSDLLNRNSDSLRSRFLTPMVERGQLKLRYPDKPNRIDQAYKAVLKGSA